MEEKIDWFFEDDEDWLDNEELDDEVVQEITNTKKRPLGAISLRAPKALPPQITKKRDNLDKMSEWPDEQSFKVNKWERKDNFIEENDQNLILSDQDEKPSRRRNLPKSSRRKY